MSALAKINFSSIESTKLLLLVSVLLVIFPHFARLPLWLSVLCLVLLLWRSAYDTGTVSLPSGFIRLLLVISSILGLLLSYHTIVGRNAGSALLLLMLCLKLMEMRATRDVIVVIFLGYFIVITGFLFSQSIFIGAYMLLAVLALTTTLIAVSHQSLPTTHRYPLHRMHLALATKMLLQALPLTLFLFLLFPRVPGPLWGLPEDVITAKTGLSDSMSPGKISQLTDSGAVAFRVKFKSPPPPDSQLYWRGPVLWAFDGQRWSGPKHQQQLRPRFSYLALNDAIDYTVTLEPHEQPWLFALDMPAVLPRNARLNTEMQLLAKRPVKNVFRYDMQSYTQYRLNNDPTVEKQRYLALPSSAAPRARDFIRQLRQQTNNDRQLVAAVLNHFKNEAFYYSRKPPLLFDDPVDEFLFETRKGYCEHYASTFTVLMRLAGIPARVVTGYQGGEMNPLSDYMIIRQSDAHAWSEVWLEQQGWVRIDPTSVIPPHRIEHTEDLVRRQPETRRTIIINQPWIKKSLRQFQFAWDALNNRWNQWIVGYNSSRQLALLKALGMPDITWRGMATLLFICVSVSLLLISLYLFKRSKQPASSVKSLYQRYLQKLEKIGFSKKQNETALDFAQRITARRTDLAQAVGDITRLYDELCYARPAQQDQRFASLKMNIKAFKPARTALFTDAKTGKNAAQ